MGHALAVRHLTISADERDAYLARLRERLASARAVGTHFWAFEREDQRGSFVEFIETKDRAALATALTQDDLVAESLDFRVAPAAAEAARPVVYLETL